jgi:probable rRNA maturation factor
MVIVRKSVVGLSDASLSHFLRQAMRSVRLRGSVNVLLTTDAEMKRLNLRFRGKNSATDVLSFPPIAPLPTDFAGDIAISSQIAARNARRLGHSPVQEVKILALHGLMHLAGYDHERDNGTMARKEQRLRKTLKLPVGLIERSRRVPLGAQARRAVQNQSQSLRALVARRQR